MKNPESSIGTEKCQEVLIDIVNRYLEGSMNPTESTPPWIKQIMRFHAEEPITPKLIDQVMRSGGTDHPDPFFG